MKKKSARLALTGATLLELTPARLRRAVVIVEEGKITALDEKAPADCETLDCSGLVLMPGLVCAHSELYQVLSRGMPAPAEAPHSFSQMLERVRYKLEDALDGEAVEVSAQVAALEALRSGVTTLIDHHASPACIDGSLDLIGGALEQVGVRGVLSYQTTDRGGADQSRAGLRENDRFLTALRKKTRPLLRGMAGGHAPFTLSDQTAEALADVAARQETGVHLQLAEDSLDALKDGRSVVDWLAMRGLLGPRSLLAHATHVSDTDAARIVASGAHVAHTARANLHHAVGYARPARFHDSVLLGTAAPDSDIRLEAHTASLLARAHHHSFDAAAALDRNRTFAAYQFGTSLALEPGAAADLIALDYRPPTPLTESNAPHHLLSALTTAPVRHVLCAGAIVLRDGHHPTLDEDSLFARARECATHLWTRISR